MHRKTKNQLQRNTLDQRWYSEIRRAKTKIQIFWPTFSYDWKKLFGLGKKSKNIRKNDGGFPVALIVSALALTVIDTFFCRGQRNGKRKRRKRGNKTFFYQNCSYRNRNRTNKMIVKGEQCIFGGTDELYYIEIKKKLSREKKHLRQAYQIKL